MMIYRQLDIQEHGRTRELYEEVFSEDDAAFVDYYYDWKTKDNIIFVAENVEGIQAMIQLNPFTMYLDGKLSTIHYIVAVATREKYRHQGLMRKLLSMVEKYMQEAGETFTFLMPADEKIYLPFGYHYFCGQRSGIWMVVQTVQGERNAKCRPVCIEEYAKLAEFANQTIAEEYRMFIYRDSVYYKRLVAEQQCQGGDVMLIIDEQDQMIGSFCFAKIEPSAGEAYELRELIIPEKYQQEAIAAIQEFVNEKGNCRVIGCPSRIMLTDASWKPHLMGKVPGKNYQNLCKLKEIFINEVV